jgi:hypothetical protein
MKGIENADGNDGVSNPDRDDLVRVCVCALLAICVCGLLAQLDIVKYLLSETHTCQGTRRMHMHLLCKHTYTSTRLYVCHMTPIITLVFLNAHTFL